MLLPWKCEILNKNYFVNQFLVMNKKRDLNGAGSDLSKGPHIIKKYKTVHTSPGGILEIRNNDKRTYIIQ